MKTRILILMVALCISASAYADDSQLGQSIYDKACHICHNSATAPVMKAPTAHDTAAWSERYKNAEVAIKGNTQFKTPIDYFTSEVRNGKNAMVPGGMCQNDSTADKKCTDDEYRAAIKFMMSKQP